MASITGLTSNHPEAITQSRSLAASQGALLSGRMLYSPAIADGSCVVSSADSAVIYGLLLNDTPDSAAAQVVDVVVSGRVSKSVANKAKGTALTEPEIAALRAIGVIIVEG